MSDVEEVQVIEPGQAEVEPDDYEEMLRARIPLSNNPRKAAYLHNRACGFSFRESCVLAEVTATTVHKWRREDPEFVLWEGERLDFLQQHVAGDLLRMEFTRNLRLVLRRDSKILLRAVGNLEGMSEREFDLLKIIRKHYTFQDLIAVDRAVVPDRDALPPGTVREKFTYEVEGRVVDDENTRRAAARELLDRFEANSTLAKEQPKLPPPDGDKPLTGEVLSGNGSSA